MTTFQKIISIIILLVLVAIIYNTTRDSKNFTPPNKPPPEISSPIWNTDTPQASFTYNQKLIDPACLGKVFEMSDTSAKEIALSECTRPEITEKLTLSDEEYIENLAPSNTDDRGYELYRVIATTEHNEFWINFIQNTGGSGVWNTLLKVHLTPTHLIVLDTIVGGDRCNGGLSSPDITIKDDMLLFSYNVTPMDIIELGHPGVELEPYKDLESSAASCFGTTNYERNLKQHTSFALPPSEDKLVSVTLLPYAGDSLDGWTENYTYQPCFNILFKSQLTKGSTTLNRDEIAQFADTFIRTCTK